MAVKATKAGRSRPQKARRWKNGFGLGAAFNLLLAMVFWLMVNYLAIKYYHSADWSQTQLYDLSPKSLQLLDRIDKDVNVTMLFDANDRYFPQVENSLRKYSEKNPRIRISRVDPVRHTAQVNDLKQRYLLKRVNLPKTDESLGREDEPPTANQVIFSCEGKWHTVARDEIFEKKTKDNKKLQLDTRDIKGLIGRSGVEFHGESLFSSALLKVTTREPAVVYFLQGHNERDPDSFEPQYGYSNLRKRLEQDNILVKRLLIGVDGIPEDCDVLVIAGPKKRIAPTEIDKIARYFESRGRALILLDSVRNESDESGIEDLLSEWNIRVGNDVVIPSDKTFNRQRITISEYGDHLITDSLRGYATDFFSPRSIQGLATNQPGVVITPLVSSAADGWAETDLEIKPAVFDEGRDIKGPVAFGVAAEYGVKPEVDLAVDPLKRLVVIGNSGFAANNSLSGGSEQLFTSSVNWLLGREYLVAAAPKTMDVVKLNLAQGKRERLYFLVIIGLPLLLALFGMAVWGVRRS